MREDLPKIGLSGLTILLALILTISAPAALSQETMLVSKAVGGALPISDPESEFWDGLPSLQFPVAGQNITTPMLLGTPIKQLTISSANNGTWIAFHVRWNDATRNVNTSKTEAFRDAVAIMLPILNETKPPFLGMGEVAKPVNVWHWKADWQQDIDTFFQDLQQAHPNVWVNFYPFAQANQSNVIPGVANLSKSFISGWAANNPLSNPFKITPVEDLIAEGFGTLTTQPHQDVIGRGVWKDGQWQVVFARPLVTSDGSDVQFRSGSSRFVAFAVWDGANNEVDGRKSISNWHTLQVESVVPEEGIFVSRSLWQVVGVAGTFVLSAVILLAVAHDWRRKSRIRQ